MDGVRESGIIVLRENDEECVKGIPGTEKTISGYCYFVIGSYRR